MRGDKNCKIVAITEGFDEELASITRLLILSTLYILGPCTRANIAKLLKLSWGKLSTHLSRLERAGYIERVRVITEERPRVLVKITDKGAEKLLSHLNAILRLHEVVEARE